VRAGDRVMTRLADRASSDLPGASAIEVFRCNVDYSGSGTTWGCHESYLHRADPAKLAKHLLSHLVTRVVYTGAGGFSSLSAGLEFSLSPRVHHLVATASDSSTSQRGILHHKDEPLCGGGYRRLHVLCGESCCSDVATWLKIGTTALIVALTEAGHAVGDGVHLVSPLQAMRAAAGDPDCCAPLAVEGGRTMRAMDVQRHYLARVEAHLGSALLPAWAAEVCREWRATLDRLQSASRLPATALDWAIKRRLYEEYACRRGFTWHSIAQWNEIMAALNGWARDTEPDRPRRAKTMLWWTTAARGRLPELVSLLRARGLRVADIPGFLRLRHELFEIDMRFGQVGGKGIFAALDADGVLTHRVRGVHRIDAAMVEPPARGRAALRGRVIGGAWPGRYACGWDQIHDPVAARIIDLSDPFETRERWTAREAEPRDEGFGLEQTAPARPTLRGLFRRGRSLIGRSPSV
jgi:hypothetical protein